jgi:transposase-like protein
MPRPKRSFPAKFKFQVVLELLRAEKTTGQIAKAYQVHPNSLSQWKQQFLEKGSEIFSRDTSATRFERRIADLEQLIGKKEVELALLKNFLGNSR